MSTCLALLKGPLDHKQLEHWSTTEIFEDRILHVETLTGTDPVGGQLTADAFVIPPEVDPKWIAGLVVFDCETSLVSSYGFQIPALGIQCLKDQNIICIRGWCDDAPTVEEYESDCTRYMNDPCALYEELWCCRLKLVKEEQKVSVAFKDRRVQFQPKVKAHLDELNMMMQEAKADCDACNGIENTFRGRRMNHSCAPKYQRNKCGCC